jgi:serine protease AprX
VAELWVHYAAIARETFARPPARTKSKGEAAELSKVDSLNAASLDTEVQIWSIQRNRRAFREGIKPKKVVLPPGATRVAPVRLSYQTIKADAAIKLFSISTADLTWAIIDTGIDAKHPAFATPDPDLPSRVVATLDFTRLRDLLAEEFDLDQLVKDFPWKPTDPSTDADRKKKLLVTINSIRRRNVNGRELDWSLLEPLIHRDPVAPDTPVPLDAHGTHVAGILASRELEKDEAGNDARFIGVCPDIKLYDLRVFGDDGGGDEFTILAALDYVSWVNRDPERPTIHGVNLSLSLRHEVDAHACGRTPVCNACNRLVGAGTVVVAAAGNAGFDPSMGKATLGSGYRTISITDPGNADLVITVGATHRNDPHTYGVSYFSSRGPTGDGRQKPDLVAPGEKINSSVPGAKMMIKDGTSMAAPHVSGACALLMARHREFIGQPMRIKDVLMKTATDLGRERRFQGAGLVDALRALQSV